MDYPHNTREHKSTIRNNMWIHNNKQPITDQKNNPMQANLQRNRNLNETKTSSSNV